MDAELFFLCCLNFIIHLIATLAYAIRIAGSRTGRVAISLSLYNILILVSRVSYVFQAPLLAKRVETSILEGTVDGGVADFRWLIVAASLATFAGILLIPTSQRIFTHAVNKLNIYQSVPRLLMHSVTPRGIKRMIMFIRAPRLLNVRFALTGGRISTRLIIYNTIAIAIFTVGVLASIYAAYLNPELRATSGQLSAIVNGVATILLFVFIDPRLSMITDEVVNGERSEAYLRRSVIWLAGSRFAGTVLAQTLLIPGAIWIVFIAERL